jgi:hypothetical protein
VRGLGGWYLYEIALWLHAGNLFRHGFRNRLTCHLLQSNSHGFRIKCHLLQSIILSLSLFPVGQVNDEGFGFGGRLNAETGRDKGQRVVVGDFFKLVGILDTCFRKWISSKCGYGGESDQNQETLEFLTSKGQKRGH